MLHQRGNYTMLTASLGVIVIGFAALSVDIGLVNLAHQEAQATADAASHAAFITFRREYSVADGNEAADFILAYNDVGLGTARYVNGGPEYGTYDFLERSFEVGRNQDGSANAVRVTLSREGANAVDLLLAPILGIETAEVRAEAITAQQRRAVISVQDMSGTMMDRFDVNTDDTTDAVNVARIANLAFLDYLADHSQPEDMLGLAMFAQYGLQPPTTDFPYGRRAVDHMDPDVLPWAPLMPVVAEYDLLRERIDGICSTLVAQPGKPWETTPQPCPFSGENHPVELDVPGGEGIGGSTNGEVGIGMAITHLIDRTDQAYFRAIVFFSDGLMRCDIHGVTNTPLAEQRVLEQADRAWENDIHIWSILYYNDVNGLNSSLMEDVVRGSGFYQHTPDLAQLPALYEQVARSMPPSLVY